jgi:hypothetical protein
VALVDPAGHAYPAVQLPLQVAVRRPVEAGLYQVPAGQKEHDPDPARLYRPTGQTDAVAFLDPAGHAYPAMQLPLQAAVLAPEATPNLPAGHSLHDHAPATLYCPAVHMDAVAFLDPEGHAYPAVQLPLQVAFLRPTEEGLNQVPGGHSEHTPAPATL